MSYKKELTKKTKRCMSKAYLYYICSHFIIQENVNYDEIWYILYLSLHHETCSIVSNYNIKCKTEV